MLPDLLGANNNASAILLRYGSENNALPISRVSVGILGVAMIEICM